MINANFDNMFKDVINGKSVRECEKIYNINRETFVKTCKKMFPEGSNERKKLEEILKKHKSELQKKNLNEKELRKIIEGLISGEIKSKSEALQMLDGKIYDILTLTEKMTEYVNNSNDKTLQAGYIGYLAKKNPDYSNINFKALIIEMIYGQYSQTEIAEIYNIPARTVSREVAKLEKDEAYHELYSVAKELAIRKIKQGKNKKIFTDFEWRLIESQLEDYDEGAIIIENAKSAEVKKYEKSKKILNDVEKTGLNQKEAAEKLGISISSIRRAKVFVKNYEKENEVKEI